MGKIYLQTFCKLFNETHRQVEIVLVPLRVQSLLTANTKKAGYFSGQTYSR